MLIIDTHAHIYSPDETRYPPREKPNRPPGGKASLKDLRRVCVANGVDGVCAVQTSSFYHFDNRYTVDSAAANRSWVTGVCTLNPDDPMSPDLLRRYVREFNVTAMRSIPAASDRYTDVGVEALWKTAQELDIVINVLTGRERVDQVETLIRKFPKLRVLIDHGFNLRAGDGLEPTLAALRRVAKYPNVHVKLTFVPTGSASGFPCADMHQPCLDVIKIFGAERCAWGSDFPNHLWTPKVTFAEHLRIFTTALPLSDSDRRAVLGTTANRLYFGGKLQDEQA